MTTQAKNTNEPIQPGNFWRLIRNIRRGYYENNNIREDTADLIEGKASKGNNTEPRPKRGKGRK